MKLTKQQKRIMEICKGDYTLREAWEMLALDSASFTYELIGLVGKLSRALEAKKRKGRVKAIKVIAIVNSRGQPEYDDDECPIIYSKTCMVFEDSLNSGEQIVPATLTIPLPRGK